MSGRTNFFVAREIVPDLGPPRSICVVLTDHDFCAIETSNDHDI